ncbi:MAG: DnaJ domain-containing protein [Ruminococcus callidus]
MQASGRNSINAKKNWKRLKNRRNKNMDPYEVLGIPRNASDQEVKKAYRALEPEVSSGRQCR